MAKEINTEIVIHASKEKVWSVLTDFEGYPNWNPFIKLLTGDVQVGNNIMIRIEPPNGKGMTFKPKVLAYEANKELRWIGQVVFKGLFDGEHKFELVDNGNGTTTFKQSEKFKGILVSLFPDQLYKNTEKGFEEMNKKIKEKSEQN